MRKILRPLLWAFLLVLGASCSTRKTATPSRQINSARGRLPRTDSFMTNLLSAYPQYFDTLIRQNGQWQIQIIYTEIDRQAGNRPVLTHHYFNVDPRQYFYPASTVKMPVAALALQKLNELQIEGLDKNTTMISGAAAPGQTPVYNDPTTEDDRPTIAHYIKKIFLVSDNGAYNRLYEFLGQEYLNNSLHKMGYDSVQLLHRLQVSLSEEENRSTNPVSFYDSTGRVIWEQPLRRSNLPYQQRRHLLGTGYMSGNKLVAQPFDFSQKNRFSLTDLHSVLQSLVFPETVPEQQRFTLTEDDYRFLYKYMSMKPRESRYPSYDTTYTDAYVKFLLFGGIGSIDNPSIRSFNKVGEAYG
ncbi:MAG TPA: serine hydrolase, partial [Flavisolibacter sp.]|nr:serine hydrolase [Flavisolibacter sp.]